MAKVYRGLKSRVAGVAYGVVLVAFGIGAYVFIRQNVFAGSFTPSEPLGWAPVALIVLILVAGLLNVGKALLQDEYRIVVNYHRRDLSVQFGHKLLE